MRCSVACVPVGGAQERVEIHLIAHPEDNQMEARMRLTEQFATFDAAKAQCFLAKDREHLLAVIEAGFGDFYDFNLVARNLFASRLHDHELELSSRSMSLALTFVNELVADAPPHVLAVKRAASFRRHKSSKRGYM